MDVKLIKSSPKRDMSVTFNGFVKFLKLCRNNIKGVFNSVE